MNTISPVIVRVTHRFNASPERVFDAWLSPHMIGAWMFGSNIRDEEVLGVAIDARVGGAFSFRVRRQGQEIDHVGQYLEIVRPARLAFTWGVAGSDSSKVTVDIKSHATGSELVLTHELHPAWADFAERNEQGWTKILASFDRGLEETIPGGSGINDTYGLMSDPYTMTLERMLPGPIERVWQYLVDPEKRGQWFAAGPMEARVGGVIELRFKHSELSPHIAEIPAAYKSMENGHVTHGCVTQWDPPHLLGFTFGVCDGSESHVTFRLTPVEDKVRMVITHWRLGDQNAVFSVARGWHTHAVILLARLAGTTPPPFWTTHEMLDERYRQHLRMPAHESAD